MLWKVGQSLSTFMSCYWRVIFIIEVFYQEINGDILTHLAQSIGNLMGEQNRVFYIGEYIEETLGSFLGELAH